MNRKYLISHCSERRRVQVAIGALAGRAAGLLGRNSAPLMVFNNEL